MAFLRKDLENYLNGLLPISGQDASANGLQIAGHNQIKKIAFGVSANLRTIEQATLAKADALVVHHGLFWKGQPYPLVGVLKERVAKLLEHQCSLFAYHLPLDIHPVFGNNAMIGKLLSLPALQIQRDGLVYISDHTYSPDELLNLCRKHFHPQTKLFEQENLDLGKKSWSIAWCSGAGGSFFEDINCDYFLSGEFSEHHYDLAREKKTCLIRAGHYATEQYGIKALQEHCQIYFTLHSIDIECIFIDAWSPW
ncbi:MAG: Nif3-like dinuclear metal center hexameric protein [Gammaproteobacteria bacterium]|nr:Nif3-like dinuclear metal center hexameric protein [Gammaproteobacteria bacterium]